MQLTFPAQYNDFIISLTVPDIIPADLTFDNSGSLFVGSIVTEMVKHKYLYLDFDRDVPRNTIEWTYTPELITLAISSGDQWSAVFLLELIFTIIEKHNMIDSGSAGTPLYKEHTLDIAIKEPSKTLEFCKSINDKFRFI